MSPRKQPFPAATASHRLKSPLSYLLGSQCGFPFFLWQRATHPLQSFDGRIPADCALILLTSKRGVEPEEDYRVITTGLPDPSNISRTF
jgi:hypothetical protein